MSFIDELNIIPDERDIEELLTYAIALKDELDRLDQCTILDEKLDPDPYSRHRMNLRDRFETMKISVKYPKSPAWWDDNAYDHYE